MKKIAPGVSIVILSLQHNRYKLILFHCLIIFILLGYSSTSHSQTLAQWSLFNTSTNTASTVATGVTASNEAVGAGGIGDQGYSAANGHQISKGATSNTAWGFTGATNGYYLDFTITPSAGYSLSVTQIAASHIYIGGSTGTPTIRLYTLVDANPSTATLLAGFTAQGTQSISSSAGTKTTALGTPISVTSGNYLHFRIYFSFSSTGADRDLAFKNVTITGTATSTLPPNPTAITFTTPATCSTDRLTLSWTGPAGYNAATNSLVAFLKQGSAVTAGTPTNLPGTYTANANFSTPGTAYQNDAAAFCIYNGDGTNAAGDHSGLTITGLSPNTTYYLLLFNVLDATPTYSAGGTANGTTLITPLAEPSNQPTAFAKGTLTTTNIPLTWTAATGAQLPDGYIIKASNTATPAEPADFTDPANQANISVGTANVKTSASPYSSFTGFSAGTMYYFRINSYTNTGSCINFKNAASASPVAGPSINAATLPDAVTSPLISLGSTTATISWTLPGTYNSSNHTTLVFVKSSSGVGAGTPTNAPSAYPSVSTNFASPGTAYQFDPAAYCVYKGDGTSVSITGLTTGLTYYVVIFTVVDASNSDASNSSSAIAAVTGTTPVTYTWNGGSSGSWATPANWTPTRSSISTTDILQFNSGGTITATNIPVSETIAQVLVTGNSTVTLQSSGSSTLTISHIAITGSNPNDLTITTGSSLTMDNTVSITLGSGTTADISGTLTVKANSTFNTDGSSVLTTVSGSLNVFGTVTCTSTTKLVLNNGAVFNHAVNGGTVPYGTWNTNSKLLISGVTSALKIDGLGQSFSKLEWNCPSQNSASKLFVLGAFSGASAGDGAGPDTCLIRDTFFVKSTGSDTLQLTSSGGQRSFTVGNYFQYGGIVAINYNTNGTGVRTMIVSNTCYVDNSFASPSKLYIIYAAVNVTGRLVVKGNLQIGNGGVISRVDVGSAGTATAELHFNGSVNQAASFNQIEGDINFFGNNANGVTLGSDASCKNLTLNQGIFALGSNHTFTINGSVTTGSGSIGGAASSNITIGGTAGSLPFASGSRILKNLKLNNSSSASLGTDLSLTAGSSFGTLTIGSGATLTTNDNLTLKSDANGSARIDTIPVDGSFNPLGTISGKVTVERFVAARRAWHLMTAPIHRTIGTSPTLSAAWQEGAVSSTLGDISATANPNPGFGTHITGGPTRNTAQGFDVGPNNSSIYTYNGSSWSDIPTSTNAVTVNNKQGYMLFVRGDRGTNLSLATAAPTSNTVLRPKGIMKTGRDTITVAAPGFVVVGNPYASTINFNNINRNGVVGSNTYYLWDPNLTGNNGVGAFVTFNWNGSSYDRTVTTSGATYTGAINSNGNIESGAAFMINASSTGQFYIDEDDKTAIPDNVQFRHTANQVRANLYAVNADGSVSLNDGVLSAFNANSHNEVDFDDAVKINTFAENLSIKRANTALAIERRNMIGITDTIFYELSKMKQKNYQFELTIDSLQHPNLAGYFEDTYLNIQTPVNMQDTTRIGFNITADPASAVPGRFRLVFKPLLNYVSVKASVKGNDIAVEWQVNDAFNIREYEIEKSTDGIQFIKAGTQPVNGNALNNPLYSWLDINPASGNCYYYRIKSISNNQAVAYSNTVKACLPKTATGVYIFPNPAGKREIRLQMNNMPAGIYSARLFNTAGQLVSNKIIRHAENSPAELIQLDTEIAKGVYQLNLVYPDNHSAILKLLYK